MLAPTQGTSCLEFYDKMTDKKCEGDFRRRKHPFCASAAVVTEGGSRRRKGPDPRLKFYGKCNQNEKKKNEGQTKLPFARSESVDDWGVSPMGPRVG